MAGIKLYVGIWIGLVTATVAEVLIRTTTGAIVAAVIVVLLLIAAGKAVTIALYYQHLRYESWRLSVLPVAAVVGVTILAISVAYTIGMGM
jgi:hypothetical protein